MTAHPVLGWLVPVFAVDNFFALGPLAVQIPVLVTRRLDEVPAALGLLNAADGAGLLVGTASFARWPRSRRASMRGSLWLFALADVLFGALGLTRSPLVAAVL